MAKLKGPLFSLGASQQLAKTLVYFNWKGLNVVREYVVPANPKTTLQITQRGYITAAVAKVHTAQARAAGTLSEADQIAYSALVAAKGKIMTWFNQAVKLWIDVKVAGDTPVVYSGIAWGALAVGAFNVNLFLNEETASDLAAGKFYFGISKTNLIHSEAAIVNVGVSVEINAANLSAFLTAGTKYYMQFRPDSGDPCEGADSGIYNFVAE